MMSAIEKEVLWAQDSQHEYRANQNVRNALGKVTLGILVGPSSIGKSYAIQKAMELDSDVSEAGTLTTRPARANDSENYRAGLSTEAVVERIKAGSLVQYAVHPTSGDIYATDLASYSTDFVLLPTLATSADDFSDLGFKKIIPIGLLSDGLQWQERLEDRRNEKDFQKRMQEAKESIDWIKANFDRIIVLENKSDQGEIIGKQLIESIRGESIETLSQEAADQLYESMMKIIVSEEGLSSHE